MKGYFKREGIINWVILALPLLILILGAVLITGYRVFHLRCGAGIHLKLDDRERTKPTPKFPIKVERDSGALVKCKARDMAELRTFTSTRLPAPQCTETPAAQAPSPV